MNIKLKPKLVNMAKKNGVIDEHDAEALVDDVLINPKAQDFEARHVKLRTIDYLRRQSRRIAPDIYLDGDTSPDGEESQSQYEIHSVYNENERNAALQETQRQLISDLVSGSDERTTLIVRTWLASDLPTASSVGKKLGIHHGTVSRCLLKLSNDFDRDKFGELSEYLYA